MHRQLQPARLGEGGADMTPLAGDGGYADLRAAAQYWKAPLGGRGTIMRVLLAGRLDPG